MRKRMSGFRCLKWVSAVALAGLALGWCGRASAERPLVDKLVLDDTIQPVSASMLERAVQQANTDGAAALLVQMDTPGGLLESTRAMAGAMLRSRVPVIV